ncbi:MAG TPA: hypothetical protein VHA35_22450 [Dongiaceae bacterium]|jgi:hypothetical protein|nr:hypothetical protein [Dongiaceae bacterium]
MAMKYLGGIRGEGTLALGDLDLGPVDYELDGYATPPTGNVSASGEIRTAPAVLKKAFGRRDLKLVTEDGRHLGLRFSDKKITGDYAHVDVTSGLPDAKNWRAA